MTLPLKSLFSGIFEATKTFTGCPLFLAAALKAWNISVPYSVISVEMTIVPMLLMYGCLIGGNS